MSVCVCIPGECWPAPVPPGQCSDPADIQGTRGLSHGEGSVHTQRGLAALPGPGLHSSGKLTHTLVLYTHICACPHQQHPALTLTHGFDATKRFDRRMTKRPPKTVENYLCANYAYDLFLSPSVYGMVV